MVMAVEKDLLMNLNCDDTVVDTYGGRAPSPWPQYNDVKPMSLEFNFIQKFFGCIY